MERIIKREQSQLTFGKMRHIGILVWKYRAIYIVVIPALLWYMFFAYIPMGGLSLAFKSYKANMGIMNSPWIGLQNFESVFKNPEFSRAIIRTLQINVLRLIICFPFPVIIATMLNELRMGKYKKILQTIFTFPHFLSWVVVASVLTNVLSYDGLINSAIELLGGKGINFLGSKQLFQPILYGTEIWKSAGWSAIIYLAAITGIDQEQYEAGSIDGANRWQKITHITIPNIMPTVTVMFILATGNVMTAGFDQIFNLSNAAVRDVAETLDMYIYRITFQSVPDFGYSMAISLMRSIVNMTLLLIADRGSKLLGGNGLFG